MSDISAIWCCIFKLEKNNSITVDNIALLAKQMDKLEAGITKLENDIKEFKRQLLNVGVPLPSTIGDL